MELYLDTADVAAVRRWSRILPLAGVTTNPSIRGRRHAAARAAARPAGKRCCRSQGDSCLPR